MVIIGIILNVCSSLNSLLFWFLGKNIRVNRYLNCLFYFDFLIKMKINGNFMVELYVKLV